ncbi:hypothetical protein ABVK25_009618 [Lepraria finkii]|uniref:Uncharacterized protein n=1 Tax=Lepraria finkii TaxID=1340010 RepID=A0ABR4AXU2_9LECA
MWPFRQKETPLLPTTITNPATDEEYQIVLKNLQNARNVFGEGSKQYTECKQIAQSYLASNKNMPVSKNDGHDELISILQSMAIKS